MVTTDPMADDRLEKWPSVHKSERKIREEAPLALKTLEKHDALDLCDILGLKHES